MSKKNKLIPELRFPEFKNEGEWNYDKIDNLFHLQDGYAFSSNAFTHSKQNTKQVIRITDINNQNKNGDKVFVSEETAKALGVEKYKVKNGDLLLSLTGAAGFNFFIWKSDDAYINQRTMKLNSKKKENDSLKVILEPLVHSKINEIGTGQNNNLSKDALKEIEFPFPNPNEQKKIAYCLSSLDEVIEEHSQRLDLLNKYKKGLMQNLFPQEGKKVPEYRFPEFENDGEWVEEKLEDIAELTSSKRVHLADYVSNGIPFFRGKEISQLKNNQIPDDVLYISTEQYNEVKEKYGVPKKGDILITAVGTLGNVYCIKNDNEFYFKDGNLIWMKNISINSNFLEVLLDVEKEKVLASAIGSSQKALTMAALNKLEFKIPKNPKEQQKIASCLSALDELITAQAEKIEQLKQHKKGLMQGLFPKMID